jgi:hypothetical protein
MGGDGWKPNRLDISDDCAAWKTCVSGCDTCTATYEQERLAVLEERKHPVWIDCGEQIEKVLKARIKLEPKGDLSPYSLYDEETKSRRQITWGEFLKGGYMDQDEGWNAALFLHQKYDKSFGFYDHMWHEIVNLAKTIPLSELHHMRHTEIEQYERSKSLGWWSSGSTMDVGYKLSHIIDERIADMPWSELSPYCSNKEKINFGTFHVNEFNSENAEQLTWNEVHRGNFIDNRNEGWNIAIFLYQKYGYTFDSHDQWEQVLEHADDIDLNELRHLTDQEVSDFITQHPNLKATSK